MRTFNRNAIAAAFSTMGRLVNAGEPVVFTKIEGLNGTSRTLFKEAVTHSFSEKKHGVDFKRIFIPNEDGQTYHFNTSVPADYRLADDFIDKLMAAMTCVRRTKWGKSATPIESQEDSRCKESQSTLSTKPSLPSRKEVSKKKDLSSFSDEDLYAELQRRDEARKAAEELARKKALVTEFMEAYGLTEADILQVFDVC